MQEKTRFERLRKAQCKPYEKTHHDDERIESAQIIPSLCIGI